MTERRDRSAQLRRARTARRLWGRLREMNANGADRHAIEGAYLQLEDVLCMLPRDVRLALGGTIERPVRHAESALTTATSLRRALVTVVRQHLGRPQGRGAMEGRNLVPQHAARGREVVLFDERAALFVRNRAGGIISDGPMDPRD